MFDIIDVSSTLAAIVTGLVVGGFCFGGLWWTVRRMPDARHPLNLYFGSLIVRLGVVLLSFYLVLTFLGWLQLAAAFVGFIAARLLLIRLIGRTPTNEMPEREPV